MTPTSIPTESHLTKLGSSSVGGGPILGISFIPPPLWFRTRLLHLQSLVVQRNIYQ